MAAASLDQQAGRLILQGEVTMATVALLLAESPVFSGEVAEVDFSRVTEVDSSALGLIFEWVRRAESSGVRILCRDLPQPLQSLATLYGVLELIPQSVSDQQH